MEHIEEHTELKRETEGEWRLISVQPPWRLEIIFLFSMSVSLSGTEIVPISVHIINSI